MKLLKELSLDFARIRFYEPDLAHIDIIGDYLITEKEVRVINTRLGELNEGKAMLILITAEEVTQFDDSARVFSASEEGSKYSVAEAFVVKSLSQRLIANFYVKVNKPPIPSKVFNSEKEAIKWLESKR